LRVTRKQNVLLSRAPGSEPCVTLAVAGARPAGEFEVLVAEIGEKGCAMAATQRPDIILRAAEMIKPRAP
jgi:hypothetical protein